MSTGPIVRWKKERKFCPRELLLETMIALLFHTMSIIRKALQLPILARHGRLLKMGAALRDGQWGSIEPQALRCNRQHRPQKPKIVAPA